MSDVLRIELNNHTGWRQGEFIDQKKYSRWSQEQKDEAMAREKYLVRPGPIENAICTARSHYLAAWIAERLNFAAKAESRIATQAEEIKRLRVALSEVKKTAGCFKTGLAGVAVLALHIVKTCDAALSQRRKP